MSYQVFARKYRPQTFDEVIGQDHVVRTLANAIERDRLAHAYLFVGPRGTGKTSTARILAKALNCSKGPTVQPCGSCASCREIALGFSLDVIEIDGASNNGVEQVRELRDNARFSPARDRFKIYIIDEVHMLSTAAFNALLKTLEEPPAHVKFLFATTEVHKVLPTILSRCQRFDLRRISDAKIAEHLLRIASLEKLSLEPRAAAAIARGADGGLRDAESMLDQLVAFCGDSITENDVVGVFGFTSRESVVRLADLLFSGDSSAALAEVASHETAGHDLARLTGDLIDHLRNLLVATVDPRALETDLDEPAREVASRQANLVSQERLIQLISQFAEAESRMRWASNKRLHMEVAVLKAIQFLRETTLAELIESFLGDTPPPGRPPTGKAHAFSAARPSTATPTESRPGKAASSSRGTDTPLTTPSIQPGSHAPPVPTLPEPGVSDPGAFWDEVIRRARAERPFASNWVMAGQLLSIKGSVAQIGFAPEDKAAYDALRTPKFAGFLDELLSACAGTRIKAALSVEPDLKPRAPDSASLANPAEGAQLNEQAREIKRVVEEFENDPKILAALEIFDGKLKVAHQPS